MKKSFFLVPLGTMLILITFILSCNKDIDLEKKLGNSPQNALVQLDWTSQEKDFFSTTRTQSTSAIERTQYRTIFHTEVIAAYNQIAQENARHHFVDELATSAGLPLWIQSSIRKNTTTGETMVVIPMAKPNTNQISAFISLYKKQNEFDGKFVINGIGRGHLLDTLPGNIYNKKAFAGLTYKLEQKIFNSTDPLVSDAYCRLKRQISDGGVGGGPGGPGGPGLISPPTQNCEWRYIEVCNDGNGSDWITGGVIPLHMDHDQDGIPNDNDQDWLDLVAKGLTQNQFNYYVDQYWEEYMFDDYGDYDTFYGNIDFNGGTDIDFFLQDLGGLIGDLFEIIRDAMDDEFDWQEFFDWGGGVRCPDMDITGGANDREISCDWFYAYVCDSDGVLWWDDIIETTPYEPDPNYQGTEQARFCEHWENYYSDLFQTCDDLYMESLHWDMENCDFYSPYYEQCIDEEFMDSYAPTAPPQSPPILAYEIENQIDLCLIPPSDCPSCQYKVILYVEQPVPGQREVYGGDDSKKNGGHTFLSILQVNPNGDDRQITFGWYPMNKPTGNEEVPGAFYKENTNTVYNISVEFNLSLDQLTKLKSTLKNNYHLYDVNQNNCSDVAVNALQKIGYPVPETPRYVILLGDIEVNPGDLGEDLRANPAGGHNFFSTNSVINLSDNQLSKCQ